MRLAETLDAESALVAAILSLGDGWVDRRPERAAWCFANLDPEVFAHTGPRSVFRVARDLNGRGKRWGWMSVRTELDRIGEDADGTIAAVLERTSEAMCDCTPSVTIEATVEFLLRQHRRRDLWKYHELGAEAEVPEMLDPAPTNGVEPFAPESSPVAILREHLDRIMAKDAVVPTRISALDGMLDGGLRPGEFLAVGARTGVGKTALCCQIALNVWRSGRRFAYFTIEMTPGEIMERFAVNLGPDEVRSRMHDAKFRVYEKARTVEEVSHLLYKDGPFDLVVIDHISLMRDPRAAKQGRVQEVSAITGDIKRLASDLERPVVAACQLNRQPSGRDDGRPRLSDFRDSGSIEQDCSQALLLHDPWGWWSDLNDAQKKKLAEPPRQRLEANLAKNRRGKKGMVELRFDRSRQRIAEPVEFVEDHYEERRFS